ncbi:MAG TPA: amidohydrolase family protein [Phycisphaerae bacterium]|nr:amidohydrolase family protein [Phycisphaerae bacterium]
MSETVLILADGVVTMQGERAFFAGTSGVAVREGRVVAVGLVEELRARFAGAREEYVAGVMVPGLVNGHTHLELGYQRERAQERPGYFTEWVTGMMRNYPAEREVEGIVQRAVRAGVEESLRSGVTLVGDISRHTAVTRGVLRAGPLRVVSFGEVIGRGKLRERREEGLRVAADEAMASEFLRVGLSPHATYTVDSLTLQMVVQVAAARGLPVTMHLGELAEERAFLRDFTGRLAEWGVMRNVVDRMEDSCAEGVVEWAVRAGLLGEKGLARRGGGVRVVLAHMNYCEDAELEELARGEGAGVSVAYCPRTAEYFGHVGHRYREMMAAGVNVCLGTDSLASNPDLAVLKEAALVWRRDGVPPYRAMEMVTVNGARALGVEAGVIASGRMADVAVFPVEVGGTVEETLAGLLEGSPGAVWVGGVRVV